MIKIEMKDLGEKGDYRTELKVYHKSESKTPVESELKEVICQLDGGEPEDQSFGRDWNWVPGALEQMYQLGKVDGALITAQEIANMIKGA